MFKTALIMIGGLVYCLPLLTLQALGIFQNLNDIEFNLANRERDLLIVLFYL